MLTASRPRAAIATSLASAAFLVLVAAAPAAAQEPPPATSAEDAAVEQAKRDREKTRLVEPDEVSFRFPIPSGWVRARRPEGTILLIRPQVTSLQAQIEIKAVEGLSPSQAQIFSKSFHVSILRQGVKLVGRDKPQNYGSHLGTLTEYELVSSEETYRMVVWQTHKDEATWLIVGFFPGDLRDDYTSLMAR